MPAGPVYFPVSGVFSLLLPMIDGSPVEVAVVDSEGMLGVPVFLGVESNPLRAVTQVAGECVKVSAERFQAVLHGDGVLDALVRRYLAVSLQSAHQNIACNLRHTVQQRLCRWFLSVHDRADGDEFELTQEVLSGVVGASRQKVTVVAGALQTAGHITYQRGRVRVVNRAGLETASCECYRVLKSATRSSRRSKPECGRCNRDDDSCRPLFRRDACGGPPAIRNYTRKAEDTVDVSVRRVETVFTVSSPSGIGRAVIERRGRMAEGRVLRLQLKGLEDFRVSNGTDLVGAAVGVAGRQGRGAAVDGEGPGPGRAKDPLRLDVRVVAGGAPLRFPSRTGI